MELKTHRTKQLHQGQIRRQHRRLNLLRQGRTSLCLTNMLK